MARIPLHLETIETPLKRNVSGQEIRYTICIETRQDRFMEKYESHQVRILRPAAVIYRTLSDFSNFTPIL